MGSVWRFVWSKGVPTLLCCCSQWKLNQSGLDDSDRLSARVSALQNKWRAVWRMSVDRKKKLQDALDHLLEVTALIKISYHRTCAPRVSC